MLRRPSMYLLGDICARSLCCYQSAVKPLHIPGLVLKTYHLPYPVLSLLEPLSFVPCHGQRDSRP
jgi:hypothetical protein